MTTADAFIYERAECRRLADEHGCSLESTPAGVRISGMSDGYYQTLLIIGNDEPGDLLESVCRFIGTTPDPATWEYLAQNSYETGAHWHVLTATGPYMPSRVDCLHDGSFSDALAAIASECARYSDDYAGATDSRYAASDDCLTWADCDDDALQDHADIHAPGDTLVMLNEWDYVEATRVPNDSCDCYRDWYRNPLAHECMDY